jgi:hypothetical protein
MWGQAARRRTTPRMGSVANGGESRSGIEPVLSRLGRLRLKPVVTMPSKSSSRPQLVGLVTLPASWAWPAAVASSTKTVPNWQRGSPGCPGISNPAENQKSALASTIQSGPPATNQRPRKIKHFRGLAVSRRLSIIRRPSAWERVFVRSAMGCPLVRCTITLFLQGEGAMPDSFAGDFADLKSIVDKAGLKGEWRDCGNGQHQFRARQGGQLNWWESTGTIAYSGTKDQRVQLRDAFENARGTQPGGLPTPGSSNQRSVKSSSCMAMTWRLRISLNSRCDDWASNRSS